ncbi:FMN-binding protein [Selenomonas sputigena]|uniref:FMN-binding protein n=1 Tax=Selenomonas sputigena TaxID=69823 RepID=A0ABV3X571_9FIRM
MKRMKKRAAAVLSAALFAALLAGCGSDTAEDKPADSAVQGAAVKKIADIDLSTAKDGTYNAESSENSEYGHGKIALTIKDHKIESVTYFGVDKDGAMKGEDYGKKNGQISDPQNYKKAQNAVKANAAYGVQLVERQQPGKVDAISGATISYEQFIEASTKALDEAKK